MKKTSPTMPSLFLDRDEVTALVGMSYPTIWSWMRTGRFPKPRCPGGKSDNADGKNLWLRSEVEAWAAALPAREYADPPVPKRAGRKPRPASAKKEVA